MMSELEYLHQVLGPEPSLVGSSPLLLPWYQSQMLFFLLESFTMVIFGVYYRLVPAAASTMLARIHFWVALVGAATFGIGLALTLQGVTWLIQVSSLLVLISMAIFAWTVWTHRAGLTNA